MRNRQEILELLDKIFLSAADTARAEGELKPERVISCFHDLQGFINSFGGFLYFLNLGSKDPEFRAWLVSQVKIEDIVSALQVEDIVRLLFGQPPEDTSGNRVVAGQLLEDMIRSSVLDDESGFSELKVITSWGRVVFNRLYEDHPYVAKPAHEILDLVEPGPNLNLDLANTKASSFFQKYPLKVLAASLSLDDLLKPIKLFTVLIGWAYVGTGKQTKPPLPSPIEPDPIEAEQLPDDDDSPELEFTDDSSEETDEAEELDL